MLGDSQMDRHETLPVKSSVQKINNLENIWVFDKMSKVQARANKNFGGEV